MKIGGIVAAGVVATLVGTLGSCAMGARANDAETLVDHFTSALDDYDVAGAASLTSYPNAASATIAQMFDGLHAESVDYSVAQFIGTDSESGFFTLDVAWDFGGDRMWEYNVQGSVRKLAVGWRIQWDPSVLVPDLASGKNIGLIRTDAPPPRVLDAAGADLMTEQNINAVKLDPTSMPNPLESTTALAAAIEPVAPLITSETLMQDLVVAQGRPITAVRLRDADFEILEPELRPIPGVVVEQQRSLISADRRVASPLLDAIRNVWQANRDATAGWSVQLGAPGQETTQLAGHQGPPGPDIATTFDSHLQLAALDAVVSVGTPAAIVAISPSTGGILAAAQNSYANDVGPIAFQNLYSAGSLMGLFAQAASVGLNKPVNEVSAEESMALAGQLGAGVDFAVPGLDAITAKNPALGADSDALKVSPYGMALAAASITRGGLVTPMIAFGQPATTDTRVDPLRPDVADKLRVLMREGMNQPDAEAARAYSDVVGIPFMSGGDSWFVASKGDLAFAVFVKDADGTDRAAKMATLMFRSMAKPVA